MFVPKICTSENPTSLIVADTSGTRSGDNPTGYGTLTVRPEWVTLVQIFITPVHDGNKELAPIDVTSQFRAGDREFQIMPWDIGLKKIESGKYKIRYEVSVTFPDGTKQTFETYEWFVAILQVECCVDQMTGNTYNIKLNDLFKHDPSRSLSAMSVLLRRAKKAIDCADIDSADAMVYQIRLNCTCTTC